MKIRSLLSQSFNVLFLFVLSLLLMPKGAMLVTGVELPLMVVISGSMEPAIKKGDVLFLHNMSNEPIRVGEIVLFRLAGHERPIVHRVIKVHERNDTGKIRILTKGDNNSLDDRFLYPDGKLWLGPHDIIGRIAGYLPYVGWPTVFISETNEKVAEWQNYRSEEYHFSEVLMY